MEQYRHAIRTAAQEVLPAMPDTLVARLATVSEADRHAPATYFEMETLLGEFQTGLRSSPSQFSDETFNAFLDNRPERRDSRDAIRGDGVSPDARYNLSRVIVADGLFWQQFYAGVTDVDQCQQATREHIISCLLRYDDAGSGNENAWLGKHFPAVRRTLRLAAERMERPPLVLVSSGEYTTELGDAIGDAFKNLF